MILETDCLTPKFTITPMTRVPATTIVDDFFGSLTPAKQKRIAPLLFPLSLDKQCALVERLFKEEEDRPLWLTAKHRKEPKRLRTSLADLPETSVLTHLNLLLPYVAKRGAQTKYRAEVDPRSIMVAWRWFWREGIDDEELNGLIQRLFSDKPEQRALYGLMGEKLGILQRLLGEDKKLRSQLGAEANAERLTEDLADLACIFASASIIGKVARHLPDQIPSLDVPTLKKLTVIFKPFERLTDLRFAVLLRLAFVRLKNKGEIVRMLSFLKNEGLQTRSSRYTVCLNFILSEIDHLRVAFDEGDTHQAKEEAVTRYIAYSSQIKIHCELDNLPFVDTRFRHLRDRFSDAISGQIKDVSALVCAVLKPVDLKRKRKRATSDSKAPDRVSAPGAPGTMPPPIDEIDRKRLDFQVWLLSSVVTHSREFSHKDEFARIHTSVTDYIDSALRFLWGERNEPICEHNLGTYSEKMETGLRLGDLLFTPDRRSYWRRRLGPLMEKIKRRYEKVSPDQNTT